MNTTPFSHDPQVPSSGDQHLSNLDPIREEDRQNELLVRTQTSAWIRDERDDSYLLSGYELDRALAWSTRKQAVPGPTKQHLEFLDASAQHRTHLNHRNVAVILGFFAAMFLGCELAHLVVSVDDDIAQS